MNKQKSRKGRSTSVTSFSATPEQRAIAKAAAESAGFRFSLSSYIMHLVSQDIQARGVREQIEEKLKRDITSAMEWRSPFLQPVES
jgi:hypothetical protein